MTELDSVKEEVSTLLKQLFDVARRRQQLQNEYNQHQSVLKAGFEQDDKPYAEQMKHLKIRLYNLVVGNKLQLLTGDLKSFAMLYGKIAFRSKRKTFKITDKAAVEELARKDRILTTVGGFERAWKPNQKKLEDWLDKHPERAGKYQPFVERDGGYDEIFAQPNDAYLTEFDPNRLSGESIKLEAPAESTDD